MSDRSNDWSEADAEESDPEEDDDFGLSSEERNRRRVRERREERRQRRNDRYRKAVNSVPGRAGGRAEYPESKRLTGELQETPEASDDSVERWVREHPVLFGLVLILFGAAVFALKYLI